MCYTDVGGDEMLDLYNNIKRERINKNLSQDELAKRVGYTDRSSIAKIESGKVDLQQSKIEAIAKALDTTAPKLMGYDINSYTNYNKPVVDTKLIPIVGTVACGDPIYAEENILEYVPVLKTDNVDFALYAKGDSMDNCKIDDGDTVYIRKQPIVNNGEIALVLIDNEATVKRFYDYGDKIVLRPDSSNPEHQEQVYEKKDHNILIQGKVIFIKTYI